MSKTASVASRPGVPLAGLTTLRVGGPAARLVRAETEAELVDAVRTADAAGDPVLVLGGGSNVLIGDAGFPGTVVQIATRGRTEEVSACAGAELTVAAGEPWDDVVAHALDRGWVGLEALSGIPGTAGATPIQNVGAYGAEVAQTISRVRTLDRRTGEFRTFFAADCGFGYRDSLFKRAPGRYLICSVTFQLRLGDLAAPVRYAELARALGVEIGDRVPARAVREAVLGLRRGKGMVLDETDHDTWSAGSFFTNPVLDPAAVDRLPAEAPRYPADGGLVKTSAAWLIEHAGLPKGYGTGPARLSSRHVLALTNRGDATAADVLGLAREVRDRVADRFGVVLTPEPVLVNCAL